ncbi:pre-peptidase C-terminal domain-containing protein [bacterium]|nr:pre-peptidase C-terminal domain-containing protein [bacterium]
MCGLRLFPCFLATLSLALTSARADDFGNFYQTAYQLTLGVPVNGQHETAGDVDFFKFNAVVNRLYIARITNLNGLSDTVLRLWDTNGTTLLIEKDEIGQGETITWRAPASGVYYLSVHQFFPEQTGIYTLTVTDQGAVVDDYGDSPATAQALPTDGGVTPGNIEFAGDVDFFSIATLPDQFYRIETLLLENGVDTVMTLYAGDGATVLREDDQGGREANASRIIFGATLSGLYFVQVRLFFPDDTGGYAISATAEGVPAVLSVDGPPSTGTLATRDAIEVFAFTGVGGHRLLFQATGEATGSAFQMTLLAGNGLTSLYSYDFGKAPTTTWLCPGDGTYFLILEEPYQGGGYSLSASDLGPPPPPVDVNGDGVVDVLDLLLLSLYWHQSPH